MAWRVVSALVTFLLLVVPLLDFAWNEPTLDESQGARCQLHSNPGIVLNPVSVVQLSGEPLSQFESPSRLLFIPASIFVPPRV